MSAAWMTELAEEIDDFDEPTGTVVLTPGSKGTVICSFQARPYSRVAIVSHAQAWDAAGNGLINFHLLVNGGQQYPYENRQVAIASPFNDTVYLPKPLWIPQLATVTVTADLGVTATGNVNFTEKLILMYFKQNPNLRQLVSKKLGDFPLQGVHRVRSH